MDRQRFEYLVAQAVNSLPKEFRARLENVDVVVEDRPDPQQSGIKPGHTLLGLYEGVPLTRRGSHYGMVTPDIITIFQKPIESMFRGEDRIIAEIQRVVKHEIAHHFGISDAKLDQLEGRKGKRP
jgi:predicted Zn-dependent protease with MMP-like domain